MHFDVLILLLACVINLGLGATVFLRNPRSAVSRSFAGLSLFVSCWTITNFLTNSQLHSLALNDTFNRLAFAFSYLTVAFGLLFTYRFPVRRDPKKLEAAFLITMSVVVVGLSSTRLISGTVGMNQGRLIFSAGSLLWVFALSCILLMAFCARNLLSGISSRTTEVRSQTRFVLFGFAATVALALTTNLVIPAVSANWQSTRYGPLVTVVLVASISYAIARHKLFNIRPIIARALAYIFSLSALAVLYGFVALSSAKLIFDLHPSVAGQVFLSFATGIAALTSPVIKRFFDRYTNKLFYRDAYDVQNLFDELNKTLVESLDLQSVLKATSRIIESNLKASFCFFGLKETTYAPQRIIGGGKQSFRLDPGEAALLFSVGSKLHQSVVVADYLEAGQDKSRQILEINNVAVLVRLASNVHRSEGELGYIALGPKRSGNMYTGQDVRVLDTIAGELVIAIQNALHYEEIQNFNLTLQAQVAEATKKLRRTNEKLRQLDETKDDFISMASHQLRTPLTSVKGYISMVLDGDAGKVTAAQKQMLTQAFFSSQRMVFLIADLLNVSRLKTGKFAIEPAPTDLARMVDEEIGQLKETAASRGLELKYTKPVNFPVLMLDETKTRQVIMNFIDNAIYYTPAGGHVVVELTETPASVELRVTDDGIGVPRGEQHHLFTKFYRAANARRARPDGTGLGLFMARKVVVAQGGALIFTSQEGKGSTFGFSFSKNKVVAAKSPKKPVIAAKVPTG